ncbi:hypothetical protein Tco_0242424 [Tanacetum coccineum]
MFFYLITLNLARFLNETAPQVEPPKEGKLSNAQAVQAVEAWKHSDFLCHNYVLNGLVDSFVAVMASFVTQVVALKSAIDGVHPLFIWLCDEMEMEMEKKNNLTFVNLNFMLRLNRIIVYLIHDRSWIILNCLRSKCRKLASSGVVTLNKRVNEKSLSSSTKLLEEVKDQKMEELKEDDTKALRDSFSSRSRLDSIKVDFPSNTNLSSATLKDKDFRANSDIKDNSSEIKLRGRLLASFQDDAKYEHVGQDTRSQGGKDDQDKRIKI